MLSNVTAIANDSVSSLGIFGGFCDNIVIQIMASRSDNFASLLPRKLGALFKSQLGHGLYGLKLFMILLSPTRKILQQCVVTASFHIRTDSLPTTI